MSARAARLAAKAKALMRAPNPARIEAPARRSYRVVSVSLYGDQASWVDALVVKLEAGGFPKANRSLVIQEAIEQLRELLERRDVVAGSDVVGFFGEEAAARKRRPRKGMW